jgi:hypothetical protein
MTHYCRARFGVAMVVSVVALVSCATAVGPKPMAAKHSPTLARVSVLNQRSTLNQLSAAPAPIPPPPPDVFVAWAGQSNGYAEAVGATDHPTANFVVTNSTSSTEQVSYDLFILSGPPGLLNPQRAISATDFPNVVWDWQTATNPVSLGSASVLPGQTLTVPLDWPYVNSQGQSVAPGIYYAIVPFMVNGSPAGVSVAGLQLQ